ncbi:MAG: adenine phosphoribosyltransferase [Alphaproteobacteria bacterium CG_4_10_14_0_2_um_filter_63_37]|nr:MAG: adenine phosphoribosyltransferase [Alphaproteobacteria bacterium CG_4_10_14_0_2_um_filter_63_37]
MQRLKNAIRDVPDFPKPGIVFKDITTLLADPASFQRAIDALADRYVGQEIRRIVAVEARGFIFGAALAYKLGAGLILVRKPGKLPADTRSVSYDLEYGTDVLEIHADALEPGDRVLVVDDVLATGGTVGAVCRLVNELGAEVVEAAFMAELTFLEGRGRVPVPVHSVLQF